MVWSGRFVRRFPEVRGMRGFVPRGFYGFCMTGAEDARGRGWMQEGKCRIGAAAGNESG